MRACVRSRLAGCWLLKEGQNTEGNLEGPSLVQALRYFWRGKQGRRPLLLLLELFFRSRERIESGRWVRVDGEHTNKQCPVCVCVSVWPSQRSAQGFGYQSPQRRTEVWWDPIWVVSKAL